MPAIAVRGATIAFRPAAGWSWHGGPVTVSLGARAKAVACSKALGTEADIPDLAMKLIGRMYTATGFSDVPGSVVSAQVTVDRGTLAQTQAIRGKKLVLATTTGRFTVSVTPAFNTQGPSPVPDSVTQKSGTWRVRMAGQRAVSSGA